MADAQKGPAGLALLVGAVVMGTGPLTLAFLVVLGSHHADGGFSGLAELINEGGGFSYLVLFGGALGSLASAILAGLSVRRPGLPTAAALFPFLAPLLAALVGVATSMSEMVAAIAHAAPADQATILAAGTGEVMALSVQSLAFAGAGTSLVALAALISLVAPPRGPRLLTASSSALLALCLGSMTMQVVTMRGNFSALGSCSPVDRLTLLRGFFVDWANQGQLSNALFLASVAVAILGGVLLAVRAEQRAAAIATATMLVVAAVGFKGTNAMTEKQFSRKTALPAPEVLMRVEGVRPRSDGTALELTREPVAEIDAAVFDAIKRAGYVRDSEKGVVGLRLKPELEARTLLRVLQVIRVSLAADLELIGHGPAPEFEPPPMFKPLVTAMAEVQLAAPVRVLFPDEACDGCAGVASLTDKGLQVGGALWTLEPQNTGDDPSALPGVELAWPGEVAPLVRAAVIASSHGHVLVVRVPTPVLPED